MSFRDLVKRVASGKSVRRGCADCTLDRSQFVPSEIHADCEVAVIGEAPGRQEVEEGRPFVGKSGQLLRRALKEEGIDPGRVSYLNTVRCRPPKNKTPSKKEIALCGKKNLVPELSVLSPKVVILVGASSFSFFFSSKELDNSRGNFRDQGKFTFMTTFHPAAVLHAGGLESKAGRGIYGAIRRDFSKVRRFVEGTLYSDREYEIVGDEASACKWADFLKKQSKLSVDIEATTYRSWHPGAAVQMVGFSWAPKKAVCFPIHHREVVDEQFKSVVERLVKGVLATESLKIFHNAKYDDPYLVELRYPVKGEIRCTMLMAYLLDESRRTYGLKKLTSQYLDGYRDIVDDFKNASLQRMGRYNCEDVDNTHQLHDIFEKKMDNGLWNVHDSLLIPGSLALSEAERFGVKVDLDEVRRLETTLTAEQSEDVKMVNKVMPLGKTCTSDKDLRELLFDQLGYPVIKKTPKGGKSVDQNVLKALAEEHECGIARRMLDIRSRAKLLTTYLAPYPKMVDADGRIHCSFMLHRTVTGRLSSENPNLQNVPRDERMRGLFVASPGWVVLYGDLSQTELRVGCSVANEPTMIEGYKKGLDAHRLTASLVGGFLLEEVTKKQRQDAKPVNFGLLFMMSAEGLRSYAKSNYGVDFTREEAQRWRDEWFRRYQFEPWHNEVIERLHRDGQVRSPFGRIRRLPEVYSDEVAKVREAERMAVNAIVQGPASDLTLLLVIHCQREFRERGMRSRITVTVHDSIMGDVPKEEVKEAAKIVHEGVEGLKFPWLKVPMVMDIMVGERWREKEMDTLVHGKDF